MAALVKAAPKLNEAEVREGLQNAVAENDYDGVILSLVKKYCPSGLLGLALTGAAGFVHVGHGRQRTAFNTVWTYDLYQAYLAPNKSDHALHVDGAQAITVVGILLSIACAYFVSHWYQCDGHHPTRVRVRECAAVRHFPARHVLGANHRHRGFPGSVWRHAHLGHLPFALTHAAGQHAGSQRRHTCACVQAFPERNGPEFLAGQFRVHCLFRPDFGDFACAPRRTKTDEELKGLVYSLTPKIKDEEKAWYLRPAMLGIVLLGVAWSLNIFSGKTKGRNFMGLGHALANRPDVLPHWCLML